MPFMGKYLAMEIHAFLGSWAEGEHVFEHSIQLHDMILALGKGIQLLNSGIGSTPHKEIKQ